MSGLDGFIRRVVSALETLSIEYMVVGSFASSYHGPPRSTQDLDLVVALERSQVGLLLQAFPESDYYVSADAVREAVARRGSFNVIDLASGWKADFMVVRSRAFSRGELARRQPADLLGIPTWIASAEDTILSKLEWSRLGGGSERQRSDVASIIAVRRSSLDLTYLRRWADDLGVRSELESFLEPVSD